MSRDAFADPGSRSRQIRLALAPVAQLVFLPIVQAIHSLIVISIQRGQDEILEMHLGNSLLYYGIGALLVYALTVLVGRLVLGSENVFPRWRFAIGALALPVVAALGEGVVILINNELASGVALFASRLFGIAIGAAVCAALFDRDRAR